MKTLVILISCLSLAAARAAVSTYAEYHLGETGSLSSSSTYRAPQDSSGGSRHFYDYYTYKVPVILSSTAPAAKGSTSSLDVTGCNGFYGASTNYGPSLPQDNFAFGIFAKAPGYGGPYDRGSIIFSLGYAQRSLALALGSTGWQAAFYPGINESNFIRGQAGTFTPNTWVHLAVIRSAGVTRFYIDGVDQGNPSTIVPTHDKPALGGTPTQSSDAFKGAVDEARVITFTPGETTANILAALQQGIVPTAFVTLGSNGLVYNANLSPTEESVFRLEGSTLKDFVRVRDTDGLSVGGTAPQKHIIRIVTEGLVTPGRYPLIDYTGTIGGQGFAGLALATPIGRYPATLEHNLANSTIDLVIGAPPPSIVWTGSGSDAWDVANTPNWVTEGTTTPAPYLQYDRVIFNDSAAATENHIVIAEPVSPALITITGSENYTFSGAAVSGNAYLTKTGTGTLTLTNQNTTNGAISITGGALNLGDGGTSGSIGTGPITLSGGAQLTVNRTGDVQLPNLLKGTAVIRKLSPGRLFLAGPNGSNLTGHTTIAAGETVATSVNCFGPYDVTIEAGASHDASGFFTLGSFTLNGNGADGKGALKNSGATVEIPQAYSIYLASDSSISGAFVMNHSYSPYYTRQTISGNYRLGKLGEGSLACGHADIKVKDLVIDAGTFLADTDTTISNTYPGTLTTNAGGTLGFGDNFDYPISCTKPIVMNGGRINASGGYRVNIPLAANIQINGPGNTFVAESDTPVQSNSLAHLELNGVVSGSGSLVMQGFGTVMMHQAPAYTGDTTILGSNNPSNPYDGMLVLWASGLDDTSTVSIVNGWLHLGYSGTDTVRRLFVNGVQMPAGVYSTNPNTHITGPGTLTVTTGPTGTPYQLWENSQGIIGAGPDVDSDNDGISNAIEYVIGGDPSGPNSDSRALLPVITRNDTTLTCVFRRTDASLASNPAKVKYGTDLLTDWVTAQHGVDGVSIVEENDGFGPGVDKVTVSIPVTGKPKLFARLVVDTP